MAAGGVFGRYLRIDLGAQRHELVPIGADDARRYLGGVGLGSRILARETVAGH